MGCMATGGAFPTCDECGNLICLDDRGHKLDCSRRPDRPVRVTARSEADYFWVDQRQDSYREGGAG